MLLIPRVLDCLPQRIDHKSLLLALHMATEAANPYFRLGYNSLGAFATINHLHFQVYPVLAMLDVFPDLSQMSFVLIVLVVIVVENRHTTWPCLSQ